jgi:hypothetical protein
MIKLELTLEEINVIMTALGNTPYVQVYTLIAKLKEQATPQVSQPLPSGE